PGKFRTVPWVFAEIVRQAARGETVRILVQSQKHEARARGVLARAGAPLERLAFLRLPTDRGWLRDSGPAFVLRDKEPRPAVPDFDFNAWARYPDFARDALVPRKLAKHLGLALIPAVKNGRRPVMEGGAIEANGQGTLLAGEQCLLDRTRQVRNPGFAKKDYEDMFRDLFGAEKVVWLGPGIEGDDTHGHVDDFCRFVDQETVVLCQERDPGDPNHAALEQNRERLEGARLAHGARPKIIRLPMPGRVAWGSQRLPASYANFYICNAAVLVPTFNHENDRLALGILAEAFDRPVVGIHCLDLVLGLGAVHCLTREQPLAGITPGT
ncbi:MAG: agmatine deiminase family protein, partial [Desulfovibrionaceae bacterium]|nr:agmatine deiminase family protein [Desulfovibrionaceae bacterium]